MRVSIYVIFLACAMFFVACKSTREGSQGSDFIEHISDDDKRVGDDSAILTFFEKERKPISPRFTAFPTGSTKPKGWILEMMTQDLEHGIVGALDELYPGIKADDLYHTARRGGLEDVPEMGDLVLTGAAWETSIMWWNAETIGNWWDGFIRHAYLTNNPEAIQQSEAIVENLLESQDLDGYIGIYKSNLRYQHKGSNGELWAQTTVFRMLLAYYELTDDRRVLDAVEKAMALTIDKYGKNGRNPFELENAFGGVTHGLMLTDVCESLYRITDKEIYQDYATYLYKAFSTFNVNRAFNDIRYPFLIKKDEPFTGHGVHTYEHFRTLLNAYYATGYKELEKAYENGLFKLDNCMLPSGAGHANEWIAGMKAEPTHTATEYCTMLELRNFFGTAAQKTGNVALADRAEKLTFNAMLGSRNHDGTAIAYGKPDNCYKMDGMSLNGEEKEVRYKYSPTHSEPAVCCAPNYTRNLTYYLDQMWGRSGNELTALLYGPSKLTTKLNGVEVSIEQKTEYPFSDKIVFEISVSEPVEFKVSLRKPQWAERLKLENADFSVEGDFYKIYKGWKNGDLVVVEFEHNVEAKKLDNGEVYFQRGPLVYALDIPHRRENIKAYEIDRFDDYYCHATNEEFRDLVWKRSDMKYINDSDRGVLLKGKLWDEAKKEEKGVELVPMGTTVLRRVTFPVQK
ncbi:MAG: beta-L-arabinofuranosidase domain-containing protein [Bacteroidota bacterium]